MKAREHSFPKPTPPQKGPLQVVDPLLSPYDSAPLPDLGPHFVASDLLRRPKDSSKCPLLLNPGLHSDSHIDLLPDLMSLLHHYVVLNQRCNSHHLLLLLLLLPDLDGLPHSPSHPHRDSSGPLPRPDLPLHRDGYPQTEWRSPSPSRHDDSSSGLLLLGLGLHSLYHPPQFLRVRRESSHRQQRDPPSASGLDHPPHPPTARRTLREHDQHCCCCCYQPHQPTTRSEPL
mmetsp:Transcript_12914/g.21110  ORF Transcript_12914/g.21110 Transcript_12914/m.21110 type:complete len:230 (-) Transcript_12914:1012-1701(-)